MLRRAAVVLAILSVVSALVAVAQREDRLTLLVAGIAAAWLASGAALLRDVRLGLVVSGLFALVVAAYLGRQHLSAEVGALCSVNQVFDCAPVNQSAWSEIGGIPIAFLGAGFYAAVVVLALALRFAGSRYPRAGHLVAALGGLSLAYSAFLAWASTRVGAWCLFCISLYGFNALITTGGVLLVRASDARFGAGLREAVFGGQERSLLTAGVVFAGVMISTRLFSAAPPEAGRTQGDGSAADLGGFLERVPGEVPLAGNEPQVGSPGAAVTIVEFADFQCPYCGQVAPQLHEIVAANPDVRLVFKSYPLSNLCNPQVGRTFHAYACQAAVAAECARQQGRFWELHRLLFLNQEELDDAGISFMAKQVGLDAGAFAACLTGAEARAHIDQDIAHAAELGVDGTPALFVKGLYAGDWVRIRGGADIIAVLLQLRAAGRPLPAPLATGR